MTDVQCVYAELPLPPSVNSIWRQANGRVHKSSDYKRWIMEAGLLLTNQIKTQRVPGFCGVKIKCVKPSKRKMDIDNRLKAVLDLLVTMGTIDDDSFIQRIEIEWTKVGAPCQIWVIATNEV